MKRKLKRTSLWCSASVASLTPAEYPLESEPPSEIFRSRRLLLRSLLQPSSKIFTFKISSLGIFFIKFFGSHFWAIQTLRIYNLIVNFPSPNEAVINTRVASQVQYERLQSVRLGFERRKIKGVLYQLRKRSELIEKLPRVVLIRVSFPSLSASN